MKLTRLILKEILKKPSGDSEISQILQSLISEINRSAVHQNITRNYQLATVMNGIMHILAGECGNKRIVAAHFMPEEYNNTLDDIHNWLTIKGFAGHFRTHEEASSHGCRHYTAYQQKPLLDTSHIRKPIQINEVNTRYQRLHYAASLAIGKRESIKVIDLGGGSGSYYILLKRLFPGIHFDYTCIDFDESRPLNADQINNAFNHVPTIQQCSAADSCDLFVASGVLQYIQDSELESVSRIIDASRVALIDRTPSINQNSFWTIQTRTDSRHAFKIFNDTELLHIATLNNNRTILAEGVCPEDWFNIFNMEELHFEDTTLFKWYITCQGLGIGQRGNVDFNDFVIH